ncbi:MAG: NosD domain-containing protein, partial [Thermoplasmata archaeon]
MLTAIQSFVEDSFKVEGGKLNTIHYGKLKILIERGVKIYLALVVKGEEPKYFRQLMRKALIDILEQNRWLSKKEWDGDQNSFVLVDEILRNRVIEEHNKRSKEKENADNGLLQDTAAGSGRQLSKAEKKALLDGFAVRIEEVERKRNALFSKGVDVEELDRPLKFAKTYISSGNIPKAKKFTESAETILEMILEEQKQHEEGEEEKEEDEEIEEEEISVKEKETKYGNKKSKLSRQHSEPLTGKSLTVREGLTNGNGFAKRRKQDKLSSEVPAPASKAGIRPSLRRKHYGRAKRNRRRAQSAVLLIIAGILLVSIIGMIVYLNTRPSVSSTPAVDGIFSDWDGVQNITDEDFAGESIDNGTNPDSDIASVYCQYSSGFLFFRIDVRGRIFTGTAGRNVPEGVDTFIIFIDVDDNISTGFHANGIGADRAIVLNGWDNEVKSAYMMSFNTSRTNTDWNGFEGSMGVSGKSYKSSLELAFPIEYLKAPHSEVRLDKIVYSVLSISADGKMDELDAPADLAGHSILINLQPEKYTSNIFPTGGEGNIGKVALLNNGRPIAGCRLFINATLSGPNEKIVLRREGSTSGDAITASYSDGELSFELPNISSGKSLFNMILLSATEGELFSATTEGRIILTETSSRDNTVPCVFRGRDIRGYHGSLPSNNQIIIDGLFNDWDSLTDSYANSSDPVPGNIHIRNVKTIMDSSTLSAMVNITGARILKGSQAAFHLAGRPVAGGGGGGSVPTSLPEADCRDFIIVYLDTREQGIPVAEGFEADYRLVISGRGGKVVSSEVQEAQNNKWVRKSQAKAAVDDDSLETQIEKGIIQITQGQTIRMMVFATGWNKAGTTLPFNVMERFQGSRHGILPLVITGDEDFTSEHGVRGGSGTPQDPYIISDWHILGTTGGDEPAGIVIKNTTKHAKIMNCTIVGGTTGIELINASNISVEGCRLSSQSLSAIIVSGNSSNINIYYNRISATQVGINVSTTRFINISLNMISDISDYGIQTSGCENLTLFENSGGTIGDVFYFDFNSSSIAMEKNNIFASTTASGFALNSSKNVESVLNTLDTLQYGYTIVRVERMKILSNYFDNISSQAISVFDNSSNISIRGNQFNNSKNKTIVSSWSENISIEENTMVVIFEGVPMGSLSTGIELQNTKYIRCLSNRIEGYTTGLWLDRCNNSEFNKNNISLSSFGMDENENLGIKIKTSFNLSVIENTIRNGKEGINASGGSQIRIDRNTITDSLSIGCNVSNYIRATISNNTFLRCQQGLVVYSINDVDTRIENNTFLDSSLAGTLLISVNSILLYGNYYNNCPTAICLGDNPLSSQTNITIYNNTINGSSNNGIFMNSNCHFNNISHNVISNCTSYAIMLQLGVNTPTNNLFYHNAFINNNGSNNPQVYDPTTPIHNNRWNLTYPYGGNYWAPYTSSNQYYGEWGLGGIPPEYKQTEDGPDGFWDYPYNISGSDHLLHTRDYYPMTEWRTGIVHIPITINSDSDFNSDNGVVAGDGTFNNPYIIEGWDINITGWNKGISIVNTLNSITKYFSIRNCTIHGEGMTPGVELENINTPLTALENITLSNMDTGVSLSMCENLELKDLSISGTFYGISSESSITITISNSSVVSSNMGIRLSSSDLNTVRNCTASLLSTGIYLLESNQNYITGNYFSGNTYDIFLSSGQHNLIYNNYLGGVSVQDTYDSNYWNATYPLGGNFWATFSSGNRYHGVSPQNEDGPDGFYDESKSITNSGGDGTAEDCYPMTEWRTKPMHLPIRINSSGEFQAMAQAEGWPGDGSENNPYIIRNYDINASSGGNAGDDTPWGFGIFIGNTTVHFIIEDCFIHNASGNTSDYAKSTGIYLYNCTNGTVTNNTLIDCLGNGVLIENSRSISVNYNIIRDANIGINIESGEDISIELNNIRQTNTNGIHARQTSNTTISRCELSQCSLNSYALLITQSLNISIRECLIKTAGRGIEVEAAQQIFIEKNIISEITADAVYLSQDNFIHILENHISNSNTSIILFDANNTEICRNRFVNLDETIKTQGNAGTTIQNLFIDHNIWKGNSSCALLIGHTSHGITFSNNTVGRNANVLRGITIPGGVSVSGLKIENNSFSNQTIWGICSDGLLDISFIHDNNLTGCANPLMLNNSKNISVERNQLFNVRNAALLKSIYNCSVGNNTLKSLSAANGINVQNSTQFSLTNNTLLNYPNYGIYISSSSNNFSALGNYLEGGSISIFIEACNYSAVSENILNNCSNAGIKFSYVENA